MEKLIAISSTEADFVFPCNEDGDPLPTNMPVVEQLAYKHLGKTVVLSDEAVQPGGSSESIVDDGEKYYVLARYTATDENGVASKICFAM